MRVTSVYLSCSKVKGISQEKYYLLRMPLIYKCLVFKSVQLEFCSFKNTTALFRIALLALKCHLKFKYFNSMGIK